VVVKLIFILLNVNFRCMTNLHMHLCNYDASSQLLLIITFV